MKLLLTGAFKYSAEQIASIRSLGYDVGFHQDESEKVTDPATIEAVVCNNLFLNNDISQFKNLRFIQLTSAGTDRLPTDYIAEKGIRLCNARGVYSVPIAEWIILKILEIYKRSREFHKAQNERRWEKRRDLLELNGKHAAIIGFGSIGMETARRLKAFGVRITAVDGRLLETDEAPLADRVLDPEEISTALCDSDIIILTLPLTKQTYHLIDSKKISLMKDDCVIVNVSRGSIIDEDALKEALHAGKFRGVALDVFEEEPLPQDSPLWDFDRVIITPHNSFVSEKINDRLFDLIYSNLTNFANTACV